MLKNLLFVWRHSLDLWSVRIRNTAVIKGLMCDRYRDNGEKQSYLPYGPDQIKSRVLYREG